MDKLRTRLIGQAGSSRDLVDRFLESRTECNERSLATYRYYIDPFIAWLGDKSLNAMNIAAYLSYRKGRKLSLATRQNDYRKIKTCCRWLVEQELLSRDPFIGSDRVAPIREKRRRRKVYSETDVVELLAVAAQLITTALLEDGQKRQDRRNNSKVREALQARAFILLLVDSALRVGEVAALSCGQVRSEEFIIASKGDHIDTAFITARTRQALLELAGDRPDDAPLFRDRSGGPASTRVLRGTLQRLAKRTGVKLPPRPCHALRHFAARQWLKAKLGDLVIQQLMRHQQLSTTTIYTRLDAEELAELHADASPVERLLERARAT